MRSPWGRSPTRADKSGPSGNIGVVSVRFYHSASHAHVLGGKSYRYHRTGRFGPPFFGYHSSSTRRCLIVQGLIAIPVFEMLLRPQENIVVPGNYLRKPHLRKIDRRSAGLWSSRTAMLQTIRVGVISLTRRLCRFKTNQNEHQSRDLSRGN